MLSLPISSLKASIKLAAGTLNTFIRGSLTYDDLSFPKEFYTLLVLSPALFNKPPHPSSI
jgi:hypothetical protein